MTVSQEKLRQLFKTMLTIRLFEERIDAVYPDQEMKCPVHFCIGQEAVPAGVCIHLEETDTIFSTHRSHGHCIAKGMGLKEMMAELYGRTTGCARGKGGSMHLVAPEKGILGTTSIVGGSIPLAVGAALSARLQRKAGLISVAFFGDGAVEEGSFYEGLNFASLKKLPVLFVCENNFYATNSPQRARQPDVTIAARAEALGIPGIVADGNDVLEVMRLAGEAVQRARSGGPSLLEFRTYRWKGHVGSADDIAAGCRPADEHAAWLARCPVKHLSEYLTTRGIIAAAEIELMTNEIGLAVDEALEFGQSGSHPGPEELLEHVW